MVLSHGHVNVDATTRWPLCTRVAFRIRLTFVAPPAALGIGTRRVVEEAAVERRGARRVDARHPRLLERAAAILPLVVAIHERRHPQGAEQIREQVRRHRRRQEIVAERAQHGALARADLGGLLDGFGARRDRRAVADQRVHRGAERSAGDAADREHVLAEASLREIVRGGEVRRGQERGAYPAAGRGDEVDRVGLRQVAARHPRLDARAHVGSRERRVRRGRVRRRRS